MSTSPVADRSAWPRAARLLAALLFLGGTVAVPVLHAVEEGRNAVAIGLPVEVGHPDHETEPPHTDDACAVCIALSGAVVFHAPTAPATTLRHGPALAPDHETLHPKLFQSALRARAPPAA